MLNVGKKKFFNSIFIKYLFYEGGLFWFFDCLMIDVEDCLNSVMNVDDIV